MVRFGLEFVRGDAGRPYHRGFSQAQWLVLGLTTLVAALELAGVLPLTGWHPVAAVALLAWAAAVAVRRAAARTALPARPTGAARDIGDLAATLDTLDAGPPEPPGRRVRLIETPAGLRLSRGVLPTGPHYTMSCERGLDPATARRVARLVVDLKHPHRPFALARGGVGTFHLLIEAPGLSEAPGR